MALSPAATDDALPPASAHLADPATRFRDRIEGLAELTARDPFNLPSTRRRVGYHRDRHLDYWISGLEDYRAILATLEACDARLAPGDAILDFGCSSGRVLRHFDAQFPRDHAGPLRCWGVDIIPESIEWIRRNLSPRLRVMRTLETPPLPIEDRSISLVYAFSVFTHIDEWELAWISELRRILRPGGIAYLTAHTERTWAHIAQSPGWPIHGHLTSDGVDERGSPITPEDLRRPMPRDRLVHVSVASPVPRVFLSMDYLRREWGRYLTVLDIIEQGSVYQDVVVLRRDD